MANGRAPPRAAWVLAGPSSVLVAGLAVVAFLGIGAGPVTAWLVPAVLCAVSAFGYALAWPGGGWRWGLVASAGFWLFFLAVFVSYLSLYRVEAGTLLRAASVLLSGIAGATVARRLRAPPGR